MKESLDEDYQENKIVDILINKRLIEIIRTQKVYLEIIVLIL